METSNLQIGRKLEYSVFFTQPNNILAKCTPVTPK